MAEPVIVIDTNVLKSISRGNTKAADALNRYHELGRTIYISKAAYEELVTRAQTPFLGGHYREMLKDMKIDIAPPGPMTERLNFLADNIQHEPGPNKPGQLDEYDKHNNPQKQGDAFVAAQAKALGGLMLTFDRKTRNRAANLGVTMAPECAIGDVSGVEDPVEGRRRLGLKPITIGSNGQLQSPQTVQGGGKNGAYTIQETNSLPEFVPPSAKGEAKIAGIQLAFEGANIICNMINDYIQKQEIEKKLSSIQQEVAKARLENRRSGVILLFYYRQYEPDKDSIMKPGPVFDYIIWGQGLTRDEAIRDALKAGSIGPGVGKDERKFAQEAWIPPLERTALTEARCPFPQIGIGQFYFGNGSSANFQLVEFNTLSGFDDISVTSIDLAGKNIQFAVLNPPPKVFWMNLNGKQETEVPLKTAKTANGNDIKVVDLDPWSPFNAKAAMVFPLDVVCETAFKRVRATDNYTQLTMHVNFSMIRWIRAEDIHLLRFL